MLFYIKKGKCGWALRHVYGEDNVKRPWGKSTMEEFRRDARNTSFPDTSQKESTWTPNTWFGILASKTLRQYISVV